MKNYLILYTQSASIQKDYNTDPKDYNNWTRLVSLSWIINDSSINIIRPIGFHIDYKTSDYIGFTNEHSILKGKEITSVLKNFIKALKNVDYIVGHNIEYHLNLIKSELYRFDMINDFPNIPVICTMKFGKKILPNDQKFPSLNELKYSLFNSNVEKINHFKNPENKIINNIFSIDECFRYMLEMNVFSEININPLPHFFVIPFDKDFEIIFKTKIIDSTVYYEDSILYENVINYNEFKNRGLTIIEQKNDKNNSEFYLIDYRGVLILKSEKRIFFYYDDIMDTTEIISEKPCYYLTHKQNYLLLHRFGINEINNNLIIRNYFNEQTLIKSNGDAIFINTKIIFHCKSDYLIVKENEVFKIFDYNFKYLTHFNSRDFNIFSIDENNYFYYLDNNLLMGIININGEIIVHPKFKYLEYLGFELLIYSNHYKKLEDSRLSEVGDYGISDFNGNIILDDEYDEIEIIQNEIVCIKGEIEKRYLINNLIK